MDTTHHMNMLACKEFIQKALEAEMSNRDGKTSNLDNEINAVIAAGNEWCESHAVVARPDLGRALSDGLSTTGSDWSSKFALYTAQWIYMGLDAPGYIEREALG